VLYAKPNGQNLNRFGITVSKKIGKANVRNRAKRRLREVLRLNAPYMKSGFDFVVVARSHTPEIEFSKLASDLSVALKKVGAFLDE
jgi:ribonuclease P protein component